MDLTTRLSLYYSQQSEKEIRNCSTNPAAMKLWGHVSLNPAEPQCDQENKESASWAAVANRLASTTWYTVCPQLLRLHSVKASCTEAHRVTA